MASPVPECSFPISLKCKLFFSHERGRGYTVMEFVTGKAIDPLEETAAVEKVAGVLDYFTAIRRNIPGSLCGGPCRDLLFPETEYLIFVAHHEYLI